VKTQPVTPAQIEFDADPQPAPLAAVRRCVSPAHRRDGPGAPCLPAGQRPARALGRPGGLRRAGAGFGLGNNFLATWDAWRRDPARCERLHYVAVELHPPTAADLARAHAGAAQPDLAAALVQAWPPLTPNLQGLNFEGGAGASAAWRWATPSSWLPGLRLAGRRDLSGRLCTGPQPAPVGAALPEGTGPAGRTRRDGSHLERGHGRPLGTRDGGLRGGPGARHWRQARDHAGPLQAPLCGAAAARPGLCGRPRRRHRRRAGRCRGGAGTGQAGSAGRGAGSQVRARAWRLRAIRRASSTAA
jgi:hypothetical protein